jgi:hypothetical protein
MRADARRRLVTTRQLVGVRAALRALHSPHDAETVRDWINGELGDLQFYLMTGAYFAQASKLPKYRHASKKDAVKELTTLIAAASSLRESILGLHHNSRMAFHLPPAPDAGGLEALVGVGDGPMPEAILPALEATQAAAERALGRLRKAPSTNRHMGAPRKYEPQMIVQWAAAAFQRGTGENPGRIVRAGKADGPFLGFLRTVFDALEIDASPETWAKVVSMEKSRARKAD